MFVWQKWMQHQMITNVGFLKAKVSKIWLEISREQDFFFILHCIDEFNWFNNKKKQCMSPSAGLAILKYNHMYLRHEHRF